MTATWVGCAVIPISLRAKSHDSGSFKGIRYRTMSAKAKPLAGKRCARMPVTHATNRPSSSFTSANPPQPCVATPMRCSLIHMS
ncbi:hypothetical protein BV22DRAFT_848484 [Leucogyrophana mollusca]|uniref:Uncharacterized protein n=1 Tax=Leucogyrophana mollusca TaxID=85980 RepID=A0ACB8B289_9AGAM|nr:hypothetical protein BV22DRAFT_848484 [Leucogyrophana mollusca]